VESGGASWASDIFSKIQLVYKAGRTVGPANYNPMFTVLSLCILSRARVYTIWVKKMSPCGCPQLCQMLTDFHISSTDRFDSKFAIELLLSIPPHFKQVAVPQRNAFTYDQWLVSWSVTDGVHLSVGNSRVGPWQFDVLILISRCHSIQYSKYTL